jgi:aminoglycoside phosphotransferase family enzyme/predicted kinase
MTGDATERPGLLEAMLEPSFYPHAPSSVELRETHISWVFLADDLAYKVKKPIVFPFLDYGTLPRRHEMCREEVRLNRRLAPQIYLRVVGIARGEDGWSLTSEDDPAAIEYAVEMRRIAGDRDLAVLATGGELEPAQVEAIARRLARFHAEAAVAPAERRAVKVLVATLEENLTTLREAGAGILGGDRLEAAERFTRAFLAARRGQLEARARAGLVRDCHGDLRAEHVVVPTHEPLYVYDCVEFSPALRQIDVAADLAFLVMDLARLGAEGAALQLVDDYRRAGGDPGDDSLLSFFASYRAWVRAKVAALRALELGEGDPERHAQEAEARRLFALGHRFAWRARGPLSLIVCGVAGTGKTTLARRLAELSGWAHISSDLTRKRLAGIAPTERGGEQQYSDEMTACTYREMGRAVREELERGSGAIVDATFHRRSARAAFEDGLAGQSAPRLLVECTAPPEVLLSRAQAREREPDRVSDAGAAVVQRQLDDLEPFAEVPASARLRLVTEAPLDRLAAEVEAFVDRSIWSGAPGST